MAQAQASQVASPKRVLGGEFDQATPEEKARAVKQLIRRSSSHSAMLTLEPIPFLDTAILAQAQRRLVQSIARLRGYAVSDAVVGAAFANIRGHLVKPNLVIAAAKLVAFVPIVPDVWAGTVAYALTGTIGEVGDRYFRGGCTMTPAEIESSFDEVYVETWQDARRAKRNELKAMFRNREIRRAIRDLKRTYREGSMDADEALRRSEEILGPSDRA
jgi:uncharacterized protein (DUF697 family)